MQQPEKPDRGGGGWRGLVLAPLVLLSLAGCAVPDAINPVSWYRDVIGTSKSDATADQQPNAKNLAQGSKEPYPNLGDVPGVPDNAMSTIDRDKLQKSLVADRHNAQYSSQKLDAGQPVPGEVAPPAPPPPAAAKPAATKPSAASPAPPAPPSPSAAAAKPVAPPPPPAAVTASAVPPPPPAVAAEPAAPPPAPSLASAGAAAAAPAPRSKPAPVPRGSEAPPQESSLTSPTIADLPQGETPPPAPAKPDLPPATMPPPVAAVAPSAPPPAPPPKPKFATPTSPPAAATPKVAVAQAGQGGKAPLPTISYEVAVIRFANDSSAIPGGSDRTLGDIVKLYHDDGGQVRIIGYAERTSGKQAGQHQVDAFALALERAKSVAEALAKRGIPGNQMTIEAAPVHPGEAQRPRAEVFLER